MEELSQWVEENLLRVKILDSSILEIEEIGKFLFISSKSGKLFDLNFQLILSDEELEKVPLVDFFVFKFGGFFYFSKKDKIDLKPFRYLGKTTLEEDSQVPYLGVHGKFELLNGSSEYSSWAEKAKFLGVKVLGICEKNTLSGVLQFQLSCNKLNIKPILGLTALVRDKDNLFSVKLFVKNQIGWKHLLQINKEINVKNKGFIDLKDLFLLSKQLICVVKFSESQRDYLLQFSSFYGEDLYFQISSTIYAFDSIDQKELITLQWFYKSYSKKIKPVWLEDSYYLEKTEYIIKQKLDQISNITEPISEDQYFKTVEDAASTFYDLSKSSNFFEDIFLQSLENCQILADSCNFLIELGVSKLPQFPLEGLSEEYQKFQSSEELFFYLIEKGIEEKLIDRVEDIDSYLDRVEREIEVIQYGQFIDYFLILWDIQNFCKENNILTGLGRGSAAGSLVSYLLGLVKVDPIKYDLLFERFLNQGRIGKMEEKKFIIVEVEVEKEKIELSEESDVLVKRDSKEIVVKSKDLLLTDDLIEW